MLRYISILGSTGSIGQSTLDVVRLHSDKFCVVGLAEGHDVGLLAKQILEFGPKLVSVRDDASVSKLRNILGDKCPDVVCGIDGAAKVAAMDGADTVVSAIVGAAGLVPTMSAIGAGRTIALANKETMVVAGEIVSKLAREKGVKILPVDSEHSAIFQSLEGHRHEDISKIILTASGGPFLRASIDEIENATPERALKHPRWSMGAKITIDSATLMNKGLEVIEAHWLFNVPAEMIDVVVHPQSIIHSMVEYRDGCVMAELGVPDMRAPIAYAISYPERVRSGVETLNLAEISELTFEKPDRKRFPCLDLAYKALKIGKSMPAVLNAANEIAVAAFIEGRIKFGNIARIVERTMDAHDATFFSTIEEILEVDQQAREKAHNFVIASEAKQSQ